MISRKNVDIAVSDVKFTPGNARTHSDEQITQIMNSIKEFGFTNPVLIDETNTLLAGNGRALAATNLKLATIPAVQITGLSSAQKRALILADNKLALNAGWDQALLALELGDLKAAGFNLDLTGFSNLELGKIFKLEAPAAGEDDIPEPPPARSVLGDIWQCGPHRVICGDSTSATVVEALLAGAKPHLLISDPPYGVEYDPMWRQGHDKGVTKNRRTGIVENDDRSDWREAWALFPGNIVYVWHGALHSASVENSLTSLNFKMRSQIIWVKQQFVFSRGDYHWQHEPCWYAVKDSGKWCGDRKQTTVWEISNLNKIGAGAIKEEDGHTNHSTQKPVECMRRPMINNSEPGDAVYDPFLGSGTTMIAAETSGRVCYGIELNPTYVDIIVSRWQTMTGKKAVHAITGEPFDR